MTTKDLVPQEENQQVSVWNGQPRPLVITPRYVAQQQTSIQQMQRLCREILVDNRDYGRIPGLPGKSLFDCGAELIIGSYNCYVGKRRILNLINDPEQMSVIVEVPLVNFETGAEVGSGIGAASVLEPRNKYRWVDNPGVWGYDEEAAKNLKSEERNGKTVYQIPNPEPGELLNTIVKMASKRAEVDAAKNLPGAGSALKELLEVKFKASDDWDSFWGEIKRLGLKPDELQAILGTKGVKEWQKLDKGNTLARALDLCRSHVEQKGKVPPTATQIAKNKAELYDSAPKPTEKPVQAEQAAKIARPEATDRAGQGHQAPAAGDSTTPQVPPSTPAPPVSPPAPAPGKVPVIPSQDEASKFWGAVKALGIQFPEVPKILGMEMRQWLQEGHTFDEALKCINQVSLGIPVEDARKEI